MCIDTIVHDRRGGALVEFAMLLPVLLSLAAGVLSYGLYFGAAHSVQQLAADAARRAVAGDNAAERTALVNAYVADHAADYFLLRADRLSEVSTASTGGGRMRVRVAYDATWLPIFHFARLIPLPPATIARDCVILEGGA